MTREKAIYILERFIVYGERQKEALNLAIEALKAEPTCMMCNGEHIKCPAYKDYERGYKDRQAEVLAVIENLRDKCGNEEMVFALNWARRLISEKQKMDESTIGQIKSNSRENCPYRHENGNCLPVGGFCLAVADEYYPKVAESTMSQLKQEGGRKCVSFAEACISINRLTR